MPPEWVNQEYKKWVQSQEDGDVITQNADPLYEELWQAVVDVLSAPVIKSQFAPTTNGTTRHRIVKTGDRVLQIDLLANERAIEAHWDATSRVRLELKVAENGNRLSVLSGQASKPRRCSQGDREAVLFLVANYFKEWLCGG